MALVWGPSVEYMGAADGYILEMASLKQPDGECVFIQVSKGCAVSYITLVEDEDKDKTNVTIKEDLT